MELFNMQADFKNPYANMIILYTRCHTYVINNTNFVKSPGFAEVIQWDFVMSIVFHLSFSLKSERLTCGDRIISV